MRAPGGTVSEKQTKPSEDDEKQRSCQVCGVKLSAYNPNPTCWQHTIGHPWRGPSAKPRYD
ncbi:MAG TPA: hypothetical protein VM638_02065 [Actinomycetota bacterium]|nr:hypothetical protein [Actinomycetota bacterium]